MRRRSREPNQSSPSCHASAWGVGAGDTRRSLSTTKGSVSVMSALRIIRIGFNFEDLGGVPLAMCAVKEKPLVRIHRLKNRMVREMAAQVFLRFGDVADLLAANRFKILCERGSTRPTPRWFQLLRCLGL